MRVLIATHGTRGDVQPFLALARGLDAAGHQATLAAPAAFGPLVTGYGVRFAALDDGPNRFMADPEIRAAVENGFRGLRGKRLALRLTREVRPMLARVYQDLTAACSGAQPPDLLVHPPGLPAHHLAERLGVPAVPTGLQPWVPTRAFPCPLVPLPRLPTALNRLSYLSLRAAVASVTGPAQRWRTQTLRLPNRRGRHDFFRRPDGRPATVLHAFSRYALPPVPDWPARVHTTGFWYLPAPADWAPPPDLAEFLAAGPPPVYVGFGSMSGRDPARTTETVLAALAAAGVRAVLATGWGGLEAGLVGRGVYALDQAPHDWLFPRMAAVVHHGGAGTTAAALAAGRPQVVCPFTADQPFWAWRLREVGVAVEPVPQRSLTAAGLAAAVGRAVEDPGLAGRAGEVGELVRGEDGVGAAVRVLEGEYERESG